MFVVIDSGCAQFCLVGDWSMKENIFWPLKRFFFPNIKENYSRIVYTCLSLLTLAMHNFVWWVIGI